MKCSMLSILLTVFVTFCHVDAVDFGFALPQHLNFLKSVISLHMGITKPPTDQNIHPDFTDHPGPFDDDMSVVLCDYSDKICTFDNTKLEFAWGAYVNNDSAVIVDKVTLDGSPQLHSVLIASEPLSGTKCMFFTTFSSSEDISFAISLVYGNSESTTPIAGGRDIVKKITVGVGTANKFYSILFHVYGVSKDKETGAISRPDDGIAVIGKIRFVDGPCKTDSKTLNCTYDYTLCHWRLHNQKYIWYPVPFGLDHYAPHKIEFGVLAAFGHNAGMWSPVVKSNSARCFTFIYAKGVSEESFLRVWLLMKVPGGGNQKVLLFEDVSFHKVIKKKVRINIFFPFHFQIALEGQSKTILHGVVVLDTAISPHNCKGIGLLSEVMEIQIAPTGMSKPFTKSP